MNTIIKFFIIFCMGLLFSLNFASANECNLVNGNSFTIINQDRTLARIDREGNFYVKGNVYTYSNPMNIAGKTVKFIGEDNQVVAAFDSFGNLHLLGTFFKNYNQQLFPTQENEFFIYSDGNYKLKIDKNGNLYTKGCQNINGVQENPCDVSGVVEFIVTEKGWFKSTPINKIYVKLNVTALDNDLNDIILKRRERQLNTATWGNWVPISSLINDNNWNLTYNDENFTYTRLDYKNTFNNPSLMFNKEYEYQLEITYNNNLPSYCSGRITKINCPTNCYNSGYQCGTVTIDPSVANGCGPVTCGNCPSNTPPYTCDSQNLCVYTSGGITYIPCIYCGSTGGGGIYG
ncbi:MAG: hypothetical protein QW594_00665 [Candidatus Woesearchaeota archaeon]